MHPSLHPLDQPQPLVDDGLQKRGKPVDAFDVVCILRPASLVWLFAFVCGCVAPNPVYQLGQLGPDAGHPKPVSDASSDPGDVTTMIAGDAADAISDAGPLDVQPDAGQPDAGPDPDVGVQPDTTAAAPLGTACAAGAACASGFCVEGVCCNSACGELCWACGLAHALGTCVPVPAQEDPRNTCAAEAPSTCGLTGGCDGRGGCQVHPLGTECRAQSCAAGVETAPGSCDGARVCVAGGPQACASGECSNDRCTAACTPTSGCEAGFSCTGGRCIAAGPALYWPLDEPSGSLAEDASGNGFAGTYVGVGNIPMPSTELPPTTFLNPRSRQFGGSGQPGVLFDKVSATLRPANNVTYSLWFRTRSAAPEGSDLINLGTDIIVRLRPTSIEFAKRRSTVLGARLYALATVNDWTKHLDGNWHHIAVVASSGGMRVYLDGVLRADDVSKEAIVYTLPELWVGRHSGAGHDFVGHLDELRIYSRALGASQIASLASGMP